MLIVGISGKAGVGKSTLADGLCARFPHCLKVSFADELRREVSLRLNVPVRWLKERKDEVVEGKTLRNHLIEYGAWRREQDPQYWVNALRDIVGPDVPTVIDDVRFKNEAAWIRSTGGVLLRLEPFPRWKPIVPVDAPSECQLDDWLTWDLRIKHPLQDGQEAIAESVAGWWAWRLMGAVEG